MDPTLDFSQTKFFSRKNVISLLLVGILLLVIPASVKFLQEAQILKSRAGAEPITIVVPQSNIVCDTDQKDCVASTNSFLVEFRSPPESGPAAPPAGTITPIPPTAIPPTQAPAPGGVPQNLNAVCKTRTGNFVSAEFSWIPVSGSGSYRMTITNANATASPVVPSSPATQNIIADTNYNWTVASCTGYGTGCGAAAPAKSINCGSAPLPTSTTAPGQPTATPSPAGQPTPTPTPASAKAASPRGLLHSCLSGNTQVKLSWIEDPSANRFRIHVHNRKNPADDQTEDKYRDNYYVDLDQMSVSYTLSINPGDIYNWEVWAFKNGLPQWSDVSANKSFSCGGT